MNWHITKSQDTGRRQLKQKKKSQYRKQVSNKKLGPCCSKDQQQKNAGHHYAQT
jgi:hypothetical protein